VVFPQESVNTITITLDTDEWQGMLDNMTDLYGEFGSSEGGRMPFNDQQAGAGVPGEFAPNGAPGDGAAPPAMGQFPQGERPGGMGGMIMGSGENPDWFAADITFNGETWTNVGIRFKGNSSLMSSWGGGNYKLPFRLDFDQFEDEYPEIDNQRFTASKS